MNIPQSGITVFKGPRLLLIVGIHLLLAAPLICALFHVPDADNLFENRQLSRAPEWAPWKVAQWTNQADSWLNDHFPQRGRLILWNSILREGLLEGASSNVIVGRDGWLYYAGDGTAEDILGKSHLTPDELQQWGNVLEGRQAWLAHKGIKYLFVVVPNKSTIYPEHLPLILQWGSRSGRMDQLLSYLAAHTHVNILDLRPALFRAKGDRLIFWPWDSHWNGYGLLVGCDEVVRSIRQLGINAGVEDSNKWLTVRNEEHFFDCVDLLGLRGKWPVQPVPVASLFRPSDLKDSYSPIDRLEFWAGKPPSLGVTVSERISGKGHVAMFCDSFFRAGGIRLESLSDLPLKIQFRRLVSIWDVSDFEKLEVVAKIEHPEIIIDQTTERLLSHVPEENTEWEKARLAGNSQ